MRNIILVGFMGTGKSVVGKLLAKKLNMDFVESDEMIEIREKMPIKDIFEKKGEPYFRELETKAVKLLSVLDKAVISCGGGVVLRPENMDELEKKGVIVCLTASPEKILERTKGNARPLLAVKDPLSKIKELLKAREQYYKRCSLTIDTSNLSPEQAAEMIIKSKIWAS